MIKRALTLVSAMYITASVFINDDAGPKAGCTIAPAKLAPGKPLPRASLADAHLKRHGPPSEVVVVAVTNGGLDFGTWKRIFYGEFDRRRRKRVLVKIIGG